MSLFRRRWAVREVFVLTVLAAWAIGLAVAANLLAPAMVPVQNGNSHDFWYVACQVKLNDDVTIGFGGEAYVVDDNWAGYSLVHMHGSDIFRVPIADAMADFDIVKQSLEKSHASGVKNPFTTGYVTWRDGAKTEHNASSLLACIRRERNRSLANENLDLLEYRIAEDHDFWTRWQRAEFYWANALFEWSYLVGLAYFALRPVLLRRSAWHCAAVFAVVPFLFWLPAYLGYSTYSFTSAGPSGGIVYPFLLAFHPRAFMTDFDVMLLRRMPQLLEGLSTPIGTPIALTGMSMPGPIYALSIGMTGAGAMVIGYHAWRKWQC